MYLHVGQSVVIHEDDIVGIFDLDNTSESKWTKRLLSEAEKEGRIVNASGDLPRSFVLSRLGMVYLSQISSATLKERADNSIEALS